MSLRPVLRDVLRPALRSPNVRGGGALAFSPSQIAFTSGMWLDPSDISTGFQDSAGTTPQTGTGQPTGKRNDKSGRANHVTQATPGSRPEYTVIGAIKSDFNDGTDDGYGTAGFVAGTLVNGMDCFIAINRFTTAKGIPVLGDGASKYFGVFESASASAAFSGCGTPTFLVNGAAVGSTRGDLHTAMNVGSWVVLEVRALDLSSWTVLSVSNYGAGFNLAGDVGGLILCPTQSTANRNSIRTWLGAKVGLSL